MRIPPVLAAGVAAGVALAAGGIAAVDLVTEDAGAAQGGGAVTQAQFKKLEARVAGLGQNSSAAQRISKNLQNLLGKHVTPEGTLIGAKQPPGVIRQDRGVGGGLPTSVIADGAVTSAKLAPGLLTQASAAGATGPTGPAGTTGPAGGFDTSKVVRVTDQFPATISPNTSGASVATCPVGAVVLGGGWARSGQVNLLRVTGSRLITDPASNTQSWRVEARNDLNAAGDVTVTALAICGLP